MISFLWNNLKDRFNFIYCKHCDFKSIFAVRVWWHLWKKHNTRLTKKDLKFLIKYSCLIKLFEFIITFCLFVICLVFKILFLPFHCLYEIL